MLGVVCANFRSVCKFTRSMFCQRITFFVPHVAVSTCRLKCTKHMGCNSDVVQ